MSGTATEEAARTTATAKAKRIDRSDKAAAKDDGFYSTGKERGTLVKSGRARIVWHAFAVLGVSMRRRAGMHAYAEYGEGMPHVIPC